ncbi:MAG: hypothetical protein ACRC62_12865 [Microcoleus sp.]
MNNLAKSLNEFKSVLRVRFYLAIAALAALLLFGFSLFRHLSPATTDLYWSNASKMSQSFLNEVVRENYITSAGVESLDRARMQVLELPFVAGSGRGRSALVFRFNSQNLCGVGGCLYSAYIDHQKVLSVLLQSSEPKFKFLDVANQGIPCLAIAQNSIDRSGEVESQYCWFGSNFLRVE